MGKKLALIRIAKGKQEIIETGDRKKLQARMKQLKTSTMRHACGRSQTKYRVTYEIREISDEG